MQGNDVNRDVDQLHCNQYPANLEGKNSSNFREAQDQNRIQHFFAHPSFPQDPQVPLNRPTSTQNKLMGVGLGLLLSENCKILDIIAGGPCHNTKLECGDVLTHIDGNHLYGKSFAEITQFTTGDEGSQANLTVKRGGSLFQLRTVRRWKKLEELPEPLHSKILSGSHIIIPSSSQSSTSVSQLLETVKQSIDAGLQKRDLKFIERLFKMHGALDRATSVLYIDQDGLLQAMKELDTHKPVTDDDVRRRDLLLRTFDRNKDGRLDMSEFTRAIQAPSPLEEWARSLPLAQLLVDALPRRADHDSLRTAGQLTQEEIDAVADGFAYGLRRLLTEQVGQLCESFASMDSSPVPEGGAAASSKYQFDVPKLRCGSIADFHVGLASRIGQPHLDFMRVMESEHCHGSGAKRSFTTVNYRITTCPKLEWQYVVQRIRCPESQMHSGRRIESVAKLMKDELAIEAKLQEAEIVAVVLYSGPMYHVYNAILRQYPEADYNDLKGSGQLFTTTIHVLVSALQKISRVTRLEPERPLYRGLGWDADLPALFVESDEHGCSGFTEWGFMSTTSKKEVAIEYSKIKEGNPIPRVLVIAVGSVDRGACIARFSQYPDEMEYMYSPCSFLQQFGQRSVEATALGVVELIPVRVNANLKARTVEELLHQKKDMHVTAFSYLVHEIEHELTEIAAQGRAEERLRRDPSRDESHTVAAFLGRIVEQCKDVLSRHAALNAQEYVSDHSFRGLVLEMVDVKTMAVSKFREWLDNASSSFIRFRFGAQLRTAHRRWIAHLERRLAAETDGGARRLMAAQLCQIAGLIVESTEEKNELGETRLMRAAAEGMGMKTLQLLVAAGADLRAARPDGVTPAWLAAQFGHEECLRSLAELKADVTRAANDGATPAYQAAQNGHAHCIRALSLLGANVLQKDKAGLGPVHQAAMNGHLACLEVLVELGADLGEQSDAGQTPLLVAQKNGHEDCVRYIQRRVSPAVEGAVRDSSSAAPDPRPPSERRLIISTGDISDVDGFFALAEYAKTGADVLFVMNYPAYIGVGAGDADPGYAEANPGLGYRYSAAEVVARDREPLPKGYHDFLGRGDGLGTGDANEAMKAAMTDLGFAMATRLWAECGSTGRLYFCVGGINAVNPFSSTAIKNEVLVYADLVSPPTAPLPTKEGLMYDTEGRQCEVSLSSYSEICIDFNGSFAFWDEAWADRLSDAGSRVKAVFVMGGVRTSEEPITMPAIPGVLNRFSSATMNQLYHPQRSAEFFAFAAQYSIPVFVVANNAVGDLMTFADPERKDKTYEGVEAFLRSNSLEGPFLASLARAHYTSRYNPPRKPFDFYVALAVAAFLGGRRDQLLRLAAARSQRLYCSNVYGMTLVSAQDTWAAARAEYIARAARPPADPVSEAARNKYDYFLREVAILERWERMASLPAVDLRFELDPQTKRLDICLDAE